MCSISNKYDPMISQKSLTRIVNNVNDDILILFVFCKIYYNRSCVCGGGGGGGTLFVQLETVA